MGKKIKCLRPAFAPKSPWAGFCCSIYNRQRILVALLWGFILLTCNSAIAEDINLTINLKSVDEHVTVTINNNSLQKVRINSVYVELERKRYFHSVEETILPNQSNDVLFSLKMPQLPGSYPLTVTIRYLNDDKILTLRHVGSFYFKEPGNLDVSNVLKDVNIKSEGDITIRSKQPDVWQLVLPEEIEVVSTSTFTGLKIFHVKGKLTGFKNNYPYFAVLETLKDGKHYTAIGKGTLHFNFRDIPYDRGRLTSVILAVLAVLFLSAAYYAIEVRKGATRFARALAKYASRMFLITISYYILKNLDFWIDLSLSYVHWKSFGYFASIVRDNLRSPNYEYFFRYFVDPYWFSLLFLALPYFYFRDSDKKIEQDKYSALMRSLFSAVRTNKQKGFFWSKTSKLGILTVCVKLFYVPYLISWVINNTIHQKNLTDSFKWDFYVINAYLVAFFIYIDTIIYSFGYMVESGYLKNEIKSVEPTILGWIVCLWCYPPFNAFSFRIFDYPIINTQYNYPEMLKATATIIVTLMWGLFAWASLSLGFKASNLTNRGIIIKGPYRFVRHPAYAAKVMAWIVQGIILGQYTVGILLAFIVIYLLRSLTEERHLSLDPEYAAYKKMVPWKFIPGII